MERKRSLKWQMTGMMLLCWLVPVVLVLCVLGWYVADSLSQRTAQNLADQFQVNLGLCADRLDTAVEASRLATYDPSIADAWADYQKNGNYAALYRQTQDFMNRQYRSDSRFLFSFFWFVDDPDRTGPSTLSESTGARYDDVRRYLAEDHAAAKEMADRLDTNLGFLERDGRLYLVRNLKDTGYRTLGTLVLALNKPYYFDSLAFPWQSDLTVTFNGVVPMALKGEALTPGQLGLDPRQSALLWGGGENVLYQRTEGKGYALSALAVVDLGVLLQQSSGYKYLLFALAVLLLPLLLLVLRFFTRQISRPIQAMMEGARAIEQGDLGHQIAYRPGSREFQYLEDSFNHMSGQLQSQFDRIYQEELALRDARIKALQSHINPHFLNNTLEIINWEARMNGDAKVSKMIEALSTLLDAAIARDKRPEVLLSEEMGYVGAYLYIIDQRFGRRLTVEQDIAEEALEMPVPRLILQPVIENAVEHGIGPGGHGAIAIRARMKDGLLLIDVENDGDLPPENEAHIRRLLSPDYDASRESSGNIGISNVNQRLHILYGGPSGLQIGVSHGKVVARITIKPRESEGA